MAACTSGLPVDDGTFTTPFRCLDFRSPRISAYPDDLPGGLIRTLGICLGAATLSAASVEGSSGLDGVLAASSRHPYNGDPRSALDQLFASWPPESFDRIAITGRSLRESLSLSSIPEVEAGETAVRWLSHRESTPYAALASIGAETFLVYELTATGRLAKVYAENKCASGTGEFFMQMLRRMDIGLEDAMELAQGAEPHPVSGRCSVFCKSDCTHALNVGHPVGSVIAGLCRMMADKIAGLLKQPLVHAQRRSGNGSDVVAEGRPPRVLVVGGLTQNRVMMDHLRERIPGMVIPEEATVFEAFGAALWALDHKTSPFPGLRMLLRDTPSLYSRLPSLREAEARVEFAEQPRDTVDPEAEYILGLDVGSTTTKAILLRRDSKRIVAGEYLRTHGDPVGAARACYRSLLEQVGDTLAIVGLGVTGSGRQITGLHALTDGIINEIIAHATAAAHFNRDVDTIFEIGGQDAKYTHLVHGVPTDYAMNEACSAGTGSFLEESAKETLGIELDRIADIALRAEAPANFSDQCAAFVSSDLKNAMQEGFPLEDIVAGLVYSICQNYDNKVKGSRPVGRVVFMQGGVCYNRAVPVAMAALTGRRIVVPPEPGLMGAYGVALEVDQRLEAGRMRLGSFSLSELADRAVEYARSFRCPGGAEKCDLGCEIRMTVVDGKKIPFGGSCDRYINRRLKRSGSTADLDLVQQRQGLLFEEYRKRHLHDFPDPRPTVGMNRSFLIHELLPFWATFLDRLGLRLILPGHPLLEGTERKGAAYCYPAELAHGFFLDLLRQKPDHLLIPHVRELEIEGREPELIEQQSLCVTLQAEPYFLKAAFKDIPDQPRWHTPVFNFWLGFEAERVRFVRLARALGVGRTLANRALEEAIEAQQQFSTSRRDLGRRILAELESTPDRIAIILFGRGYNSFAPEANLGIPRKLASRGVMVIPYDMLPLDEEPSEPWMYWATGHVLMRAARIVARHPQLYGVYVSNFACGPDSFLISWFRKAMKSKPSLTLEIDSHSADAGINTRIDAFFDVVDRYRHLQAASPAAPRPFQPATIELDKRNGHPPVIHASDGRTLALTDPGVRVLIPPMGDLSAEAFAAAFRARGIDAVHTPVPRSSTLHRGRGVTSCKECMPMTLCAGALLEYLDERPPGEVTVYFMPKSEGNCRFGQYSPYLESLIETRRIEDCALLTLSSQDNYAGMGLEFAKRAVYAIIISDLFRDARNSLRALAVDRTAALTVFQSAWATLVDSIARDSEEEVEKTLGNVAEALGRIPLRMPFERATKVLLTGEIFQRVEEFSCNWIGERLAKDGVVLLTAPVFEWLRYVDWLVRNRIVGDAKRRSLRTRISDFLVDNWETTRERRLKEAFAASGLVTNRRVDIGTLIDAGSTLVDRELTGETILVTGAAFQEILHEVSGVISIGPFACLPSRLGEALLNTEFTVEARRKAVGNHHHGLPDGEFLPFLAIEADGRPFPPLVEARIEAFLLQVKRLGEVMAMPPAVE